MNNARKAYLFDMGGTLIEYPDAKHAYELCSDYIERQFGVKKEVLNKAREIYREGRRAGLTTHNEILLKDTLIRAFREKEIHIENGELEGILFSMFAYGFSMRAKLIDGAIPLLEKLRTGGFLVGLVSNIAFPGKFHEMDLQRFGLLPYFQTLVWSSEFGKRKPHPEIFRKALGDLGVEPQNAIHVGDKFDRDVIGASGAGLNAIWLDRENRGDGRGGFVRRVSSLAEIIPLIP